MRNHRNEVDGLRAIAVIPVIIFHTGYAFAGGFVGVDIFFVISGYLITILILSELSKGKFNYWKFLIRRIKRLAPSLISVMALSLLIAFLVLPPFQLRDFSRSLISVLGLNSNFYFFRNSEYFGPTAELQPLLHMWSLSLEEQFYLIFPLALVILFKIFQSRKKTIFLSLFVAAFASFLIGVWGTMTHPNASYYLLPFRAWEFLAGSIVATLPVWNFSAKRKNALTLFGIFLLLLSFVLINKEVPFPGFYALLPVAGTSLILFFAKAETFPAKILSQRYLVHIGLLSYPLYLWHYPLIVFSKSLGYDLKNLLSLFCLLALIYFLSYLTFHFVEKPIRFNIRLSNRTLVGTTSVLIISLLLLTVNIEKSSISTDKYRGQLGGDVKHVDFHEFIDKKYFDCEPISIAMQALKWDKFLRCKQSKAGIPDVILLGDSHAEHLFIGVAENLPNKNVAFYIKGSKPLINDPEFNSIFRELLHNGRKQTILYTFAYSIYPESRIPLDLEIRETLKLLQKSKKRVVLLGDIPRFPFEAEDCKYQTKALKNNFSCSIDAATYEVTQESVNGSLVAISSNLNIPFLRLDSIFCDTNICSMRKGDSVIYRDTNHLNIIGSQMLGQFIVNKLRSMGDFLDF